jgi:ABC-type multidrug transport system fused ATPase/permease subunit
MSFDREIRIQNISYRYPQSELDAVSNTSLTIKRNQSVAFVGETGSGKSTMVDLLIGLLEKTSGSCQVDGQEITEDNVRAWQKNIGYVPQTIFLTDDTVMSNIAFGLTEDMVDIDAVERAAMMAHLHDFVIELPEGYNTLVGERGVRLSGGQRQRIGIARALYQNPSLLVMDEATSSLDNVTEALISEAIHSLSGEVTLVIIAHRLSTIRECDVIFYFEKGKVKDTGSFKQLIERNLAFKKMVDAGNMDLR